ncbi:AGAP000437-PA-like protein [Anopheles sinensis]|uniref:AGAP000437-PA-like protein n=1 Tax=Anopheles sinensis TaxID=74873 RepID=A0A084VLE9_ANOSI|nr:AGAP000437-PA-like protein [Anopheles sinensis]
MRAFVIFVACLAVVSADIGLDLQRGGGSGVSIDYVPTTYQDTSVGASADARSFGGAGGAAAGAVAKAETRVIYKPAEVKKHFYYHVAPAEATANAEADTLTITPKKHYKIIFIKAPTLGANAGSNAYAASKTEEKTLVYVLVNKPSRAQADAAAGASSFVSGKPEVYFIKYQGPQAKASSSAGAGASALINETDLME